MLCRKGLHELTDANIFRRKDVRRPDGFSYECRTCRNIAAGLKLKDPNRKCKWCKISIGDRDPRALFCSERCKDALKNVRHPTRDRVREKQRHARLAARIIEFETGDDVAAKWKKYEESKAAPHNYLKAKAPDELREFLLATEQGRTKCFNDTSYTEYDDPRYPEETTGVPMPTAEQAQEKCAGCPFAQGCGVWAEAEKPVWGIYDGHVWIDGKVSA